MRTRLVRIGDDYLPSRLTVWYGMGNKAQTFAGTQSQESEPARSKSIDPSSAVQLSRKKNILTLFGPLTIVGLMDGQDG